MENNDKNIVLIGMRGSGKSTVATILSGILRYEYIPMDSIIVYEAGMSIPEIVDNYGWERFRDIEADVAKKAARLKKTVNATGGGVILRDENVEALRETGIVFWLNVSIENSLKRIGEDPNRPSLTGKASRKDDMIATFNLREPLYSNAAHHIIDTDNKTQRQIVHEIVKILKDEEGLEL